jgi:hypothetical protein
MIGTCITQSYCSSESNSEKKLGVCRFHEGGLALGSLSGFGHRAGGLTLVGPFEIGCAGEAIPFVLDEAAETRTTEVGRVRPGTRRKPIAKLQQFPLSNHFE